jgi:hypothetical protein
VGLPFESLQTLLVALTMSWAIRVVSVINLERITNVLWRSRGFSIAFDSTTHQSTSYLNLRFRVFIEEHSTIVNLHGCALPIFDLHIDKVMFNMVSKFLTVLCFATPFLEECEDDTHFPKWGLGSPGGLLKLQS